MLAHVPCSLGPDYVDIYDATNGEQIQNEIGFFKKVKSGLRATDASQMEPLDIPLVWVMTNSYWQPLQEDVFEELRDKNHFSYFPNGPKDAYSLYLQARFMSDQFTEIGTSGHTFPTQHS